MAARHAVGGYSGRCRLTTTRQPTNEPPHTAAMRSSGPVLATALLLSGCAGSSGASGAVAPEADGSCGLHSLDQPAEVMSKPHVLEVSEDNANLVLDLSSSTSKPLRVTVLLNGKVALDVRTPAVSARCGHSPVYSHEYRLSGDTARVTIVTDQGQRRSISVPLAESPRWVAVQPQDGFPIGLEIFNEEPAWG